MPSDPRPLSERLEEMARECERAPFAEDPMWEAQERARAATLREAAALARVAEPRITGEAP